ncbi:MAG: conjugal transfer protein [Caryophanon sp.]|nr:conjugal transfer protein [Caryophanon sp.]
MNRLGKKFTFPDNVDSSYDVVLGLTLKEILLYIVPTFAIGIICITLPPNTLYMMLLKIVMMLMAIVIVTAIVAARPVKSRPNIRFGAFYKRKQQFKKRQKLYYLAPSKRRGDESSWR